MNYTSTLSKAVIGLILFVCSLTWIVTTLRFRIAAKSHREQRKPLTSPILPYCVPGLGSTLSFANTKTGHFWQWLLNQCRKRSLKHVSLLLGGTRTHILFTPSTIIAESRAKQLTRYRLDRQLARNALGMSEDDAAKAFPDPRAPHNNTDVTTHSIHTEHLLTSGAVDKLTSKFIECLKDILEADKLLVHADYEVNMYAWLKARMMEASTTSLCGSELLHMHPDISNDFWLWDANLLALLFGTPRIFARKAYDALDRLLDRMQQWLIAGYEHTAGLHDDPDWETSFGSRLMRKRHEFYNQQRMSLRAQAGNDLVFLAGILSNAVPATGWLLLHILSPTSQPWLFPKIMQELESVQHPDGQIDIPALVRLPLLNSALNEVLRLYVDLIMVRQVESDTVLDDVSVECGDQVMGSTWMTHRNGDYFQYPNQFVPDRFILEDLKSGKAVCSVDGLAGKFFPFGAGPYMCPGRVFAKQEVLSAVALILLTFDIEFISFVNVKGSEIKEGDPSKDNFPGIKNSYPGNVVVGIDGDMRVRIKGRRPQESE